MNSSLHSALPRLGALTLALLLAACNNDTGSTTLPGGDDDHDHDHEESAGRLVFTQAAGTNSRVYVYDLEQQATIADFALTYPATALHTSPGGRYAVIMQRDNDQVQILDGGIWLHEDHVDTGTPGLSALTLLGVKPTHYRGNDGLGTVFFDGDAATGSQFQLFSDSSLESDDVIASHTLEQAHHGIAEPRGEWVLSSNVSDGASAADGIALYHLHGDHFHAEGTLATACPGLHGGASNTTHSVFGCEDGALVAELHGDHFHDHKVTAPERLATILGSPDLTDFAALSYPGYNLYRIAPDATEAEQVTWRENTAADAKPLAYGLDPHGEHLVLLDDTGTLHVIDTAEWHHHGQITVLDQAPADGAPAPALAFSGDGHEVFVSDPRAQAIHRVELESLTVTTEVADLGFAPLGLAWTGAAGDHDDHGEGEEEEGEHDHEH
ncbi:hypothetical protein BN2364_2226 [Alloalcanivorax xenomutans]|uniref:hypothetical protein n=1 Tax=Alloalcanivorax xenomutans TaxID=1094342 RepID=UPI0006D5BBD1|nr:hypothetical protein [Alloalcanivorax xenomutans]PHS60592.1 MAG: hypothetical protein COB00_15215 [Alcanivorax sp.]CUR46667.1 hypothetical protein BN2364_2226 [Alloalcanivorax xenomutans]